MLSLLGILLPIALLDSVSMVPLCLVPLSIMFSGARPAHTTGFFIVAILLVYIGGGVLFLTGLDALLEPLRPKIARWWSDPNTLELIIQVIVGVVMIAYAHHMRKQQPAEQASHESSSFTPKSAFILGLVLSIVGLPGALPYLAAIDLILRFNLNLPENLVALIFYCLSFVSPLLAMLVVRLYLPKHSARLFEWVSKVCQHYGRRAIILILYLLGIFLIIESASWFIGYPLLPIAATGSH